MQFSLHLLAIRSNMFKIIAALVLIAIHCSEGIYLPAYYKNCRRDDPNISKCVLEKAIEVLPHFAKGIPELGVKSLDPLDIGDVDVSKKSRGTLGIKIFNSSVQGIGKCKISSMKVDPVKQKVALKFTSDILLKGVYTINGQILVLPITGKGDISIKSVKSNCTYKYHYDIFEQDGIEHMKIMKDDLKCNPGKTTFNLKNLFNGDKTLGETMNRFLNENWEEVMKEVSPPVIDAIQQGTKNIVNDFYAAIPYGSILPIDNKFVIEEKDKIEAKEEEKKDDKEDKDD